MNFNQLQGLLRNAEIDNDIKFDQVRDALKENIGLLDESDSEFKTNILFAAAHCNSYLFKYICGIKPELIDGRSVAGTNVLFYAAKYGNFELTQYLFDKYPSLGDEKNNSNQTFLTFCFMRDNILPFIKEHFIAGSKAYHLDDHFHQSLMHYAAQLGMSKNIEFLVDDCGADINEKISGGVDKTAFYLACQGGHLECAKWLKEKGADVDDLSLLGNVVLCLAKKNNRDMLAGLLTVFPSPQDGSSMSTFQVSMHQILSSDDLCSLDEEKYEIAFFAIMAAVGQVYGRPWVDNRLGDPVFIVRELKRLHKTGEEAILSEILCEESVGNLHFISEQMKNKKYPPLFYYKPLLQLLDDMVAFQQSEQISHLRSFEDSGSNQAIEQIHDIFLKNMVSIGGDPMFKGFCASGCSVYSSLFAPAPGREGAVVTEGCGSERGAKRTFSEI